MPSYLDTSLGSMPLRFELDRAGSGHHVAGDAKLLFAQAAQAIAAISEALSAAKFASEVEARFGLSCDERGVLVIVAGSEHAQFQIAMKLGMSADPAKLATDAPRKQ